MGHLVLPDIGSSIDAVGRTGRGRSGHGEARVGAEGQFDRSTGKGAADRLRARTLHLTAQQRRRGGLCLRIGNIGAVKLPLDDVRGRSLERSPHLLPHKGGLLLDVEAGEDELDAVAEPADGVEADLGSRRRSRPGDAGDRDPVGPFLRQGHCVEMSRHVGAEIGLAGDFINELGRDRVDGDRTARTRVFGDDEAAVIFDHGDRKTRPAEVDGGEPGEVSARSLRSAFDDVSGDDGRGELVEVLAAPAEMRDCGADDDRGVGDPPSHHNVGTGREGCSDAEGTEISVGCHDVATGHIGEVEFLGASDQVIAFNMSDRDVKSLFGRDLAELRGTTGGVEAAGIRDDPDALFLGETHTVLHLAYERLGIAGRGVFHPIPAKDEHREFGKVIAGEVIELAAFEHVAHRREAVAIKAGGVPHADGTHRSLRRSGSAPGIPANACTMPSQCFASEPTAFTAASSGCSRRVASRAKS